jgi:hypothetical protein
MTLVMLLTAALLASKRPRPASKRGAGDGADVDDVGVGAAAHEDNGGLGDEPEALHVGVEGGVEVLLGGLVEQADAEDAGGIGEDVEVAVVLGDDAHEVVDVLGTGDIGADGPALSADGGDLGGGFLDLEVAASGKIDEGALLGELLGDGAADAGTAAGHQRHLSVKSSDHGCRDPPE